MAPAALLPLTLVVVPIVADCSIVQVSVGVWPSAAAVAAAPLACPDVELSPPPPPRLLLLLFELALPTVASPDVVLLLVCE